jgi:hypothetical protein
LSPKVFPKGLERIDRGKLPKPPRDGVRVDGVTFLTRRFGLEKGDIIVGMDGWRLHNWKEYAVVRGFTRERRMVLEAWHAGAYHEVVADPPYRRFRVAMSSYGTGK